jgi:hypothetical protein
MRRVFWGGVLAAGVVTVAGAIAGAQEGTGPARVKYPKGFDTSFVVYNDVDRFDRKRVRRMFVNKEALVASKPGEPAPDGTVLVMADYDIELDPAGNPALDAQGRMKPTAKLLAVVVMEKRRGWGAAYPASLRNGDWDYASFGVDGGVNPQANIKACLTCHLNRTNRDFTFTYFKNVADGIAPAASH